MKIYKIVISRDNGPPRAVYVGAPSIEKALGLGNKTLGELGIKGIVGSIKSIKELHDIPKERILQ